MPLYEGHVTIEPIPEEKLESITALSARWNFKPAKLLMQNRAKSTLERSMYDTFLTAHTTRQADMEQLMQGLIRELLATGTAVWRYKIEQILVDSRIEDTLKLMLIPTGDLRD